MNKSLLIGRITKDPELKTTPSGVSVCNFTLAVNRRFKNADGEYETDFISCVAWRNQAELICKYFEKGSQIGIVGNIQTRNYEKDGHRIYITEVAVDEIDFVGSKKQEQSEAPASEVPAMPDFPDMPQPADDDLPF